MRRILILLATLAMGAAALAALWIFRGREISSLIDRYWTIVNWVHTHSIHRGTKAVAPAGFSSINDVNLSLNDVRPDLSLSFGSTKDNQLALATSGNVFAFGPLTSASDGTGEHLTTAPAPGDQAFLATRHSVLSWPTPFDLNFMTGQSPSWKRHTFIRGNSVEETVWCETANALALRAIFLSPATAGQALS